MSRFYQELHDRELLMQAEITLRELQRRSLVDVQLPAAEAVESPRAEASVFPRRLATIKTENGRLVLGIEKSFFG